MTPRETVDSSAPNGMGCVAPAGLNDQPARALFCGSCGIDYVVRLKEFPQEDSKVRTLGHMIAGGGNAANTACTASRLGVNSTLISKVGNDSQGTEILNGLTEMNVDTSGILRSPTTSSPFTYVIVSSEGQTRTCIHTPMTEELHVSDIAKVAPLLNYGKYFCVHFDSRHTEAMVEAAKLAHGLQSATFLSERSLTRNSMVRRPVTLSSSCIRPTKTNPLFISIDMEKERPFLFDLAPYCNIIFTNQSCPGILFPGCDHVDSIIQYFLQDWSKSCVMVVSTQGRRGSVLVRKVIRSVKDNDKEDAVIEGNNNQGASDAAIHPSSSTSNLKRKRHQSDAGLLPANEQRTPEFEGWTTGTASDLQPPQDEAVAEVTSYTDEVHDKVKHRIGAWLEELSGEEYGPLPVTISSRKLINRGTETFEIIECSTCRLADVEVVDTTGAGDAYIGGFISALLRGCRLENCMKLGTVVAAQKIKKLGARDGLPSQDDIQQIVRSSMMNGSG